MFDATVPSGPHRRRTRLARTLITIGLVLGLALTTGSGALAGGTDRPGKGPRPSASPRPTAPKPTVVFVHGAFADSSGFSASITDLQRRGYPVLAFANPLRGLPHDADHLRAFLSSITGPVVLVGHSYGGAVITNAATGNPNVKALVYIAAFAPAEGETGAQSVALGGGHSLLLEALITRPYPGAPVIDFPAPGDRDQDGYIAPARFREVFAADVPPATAAVMAATQRPATLASLGQPSGPPAWATIPSYFLVARQDRVIPAEAERAMAKRAKSYTVEIDSSHVPMISHPDVVTRLILCALGTR